MRRFHALIFPVQTGVGFFGSIFGEFSDSTFSSNEARVRNLKLQNIIKLIADTICAEVTKNTEDGYYELSWDDISKRGAGDTAFKDVFQTDLRANLDQRKEVFDVTLYQNTLLISLQEEFCEKLNHDVSYVICEENDTYTVATGEDEMQMIADEILRATGYVPMVFEMDNEIDRKSATLMSGTNRIYRGAGSTRNFQMAGPKSKDSFWYLWGRFSFPSFNVGTTLVLLDYNPTSSNHLYIITN